jgi:hypothetical protein
MSDFFVNIRCMCTTFHEENQISFSIISKLSESGNISRNIYSFRKDLKFDLRQVFCYVMAAIIKYCLVRTLKNLDFNKAKNMNSNGHCYSNDIWPNLNILLCALFWPILCSHSFSFLFDNKKFIWRFFPLRLEPWSFQPHYTLIARQMGKLHVSDPSKSKMYIISLWRRKLKANCK